jgi:hypothetical protein
MMNSRASRVAFRSLLFMCISVVFSASPGMTADDGAQTTLDRIQGELRSGRIASLVVYLRAYSAESPVPVQPNDIRADPHFVCKQLMSPARQLLLADAISQTASKNQEPSVSVTDVNSGVDFIDGNGNTVASIYLSRRYNDGQVLGVIEGHHIVFNDAIERWLVHTFPDQTMMRNPLGPLLVDERCDNRIQRSFNRETGDSTLMLTSPH